MTRPPQLFTIPAGTRERPCRGRTCRESVYDVRMPSDKVAPIHVNPRLHPECRAPSDAYPGLGISHFIDCPDAKQFARGAR
jgi:hypothetical protein